MGVLSVRQDCCHFLLAQRSVSRGRKMANQTPSCPRRALEPARAMASQKLSSRSVSVLLTSQAAYLGGFWRFAPFCDDSGPYSRYHMTRTLAGRLLKVHRPVFPASLASVRRTGRGCHSHNGVDVMAELKGGYFSESI